MYRFTRIVLYDVCTSICNLEVKSNHLLFPLAGLEALLYVYTVTLKQSIL